MKNIFLFMLTLISTSLAAQNTILDIINNSPDHTTLEEAIGAAGLSETFSGDGNYTVFAPTDDAFAALPEGFLEALLADPDEVLRMFLMHHAADTTALSANFRDNSIVNTLMFRKLMVSVNNDGIFIDDAQIIVADIAADNGTVHVIDAVLDYRITVFDLVEASVVHNILEDAILAAGLKDALTAVGPLTLFAPTNNPFVSLPAGKLDELLADPTGELTDLLLYHIVPGSILSTDLADGQMLTTQNGNDVTVTIGGDDIYFNEALVGNPNVPAENGIIHVMDDIVFPSTTSVYDAQNHIKLSVHPNPAQDNFTLQIDKITSDQGKLRIIDLKGSTIATYPITHTSQNFDTQDLPDGLYLLEISSSENRYLKKLIIKR